MAKIKMKKPSESLNLTDAFNEFKISQSAKGIKDKTLQTYSSHFLASSKHLDMSLTFDQLTQSDLDRMIVSMRMAGLNQRYIHRIETSYTLNACEHLLFMIF